jgi:hypothetical protein
MKNFEFIRQDFESKKYNDLTPAGFAAKSDFNELHFNAMNTNK